METLLTFVSPPSPCGYLPDRDWELRYDMVRSLTTEEYGERLVTGWRRFGYSLFKPVCAQCQECQSLRIPTRTFTPTRSQKRVKRGNHQHVQLEIAEPNITDEKLELYRRYHEFQAEHKGWPEHRGNSEDDYRESFVENPIPTEEWTYRINGKLVGVGYVDVVPTGLSAIYFYYDTDFRSRSLGTWNVLSIIEEARRRGLEYVYLGFFVRGCSSLSYKANFHPHERLNPQSGIWQPIQEEQDADDGAIE